MSKSPEEYFQEQTFAPAPRCEGASFTDAELAFMRKYMGLDATDTLRKIGIETTSAPKAQIAGPVATPEPAVAQASAVIQEPAPLEEPVAMPEPVAPADAPAISAPEAEQAADLADEPEFVCVPEPVEADLPDPAEATAMPVAEGQAASDALPEAAAQIAAMHGDAATQGTVLDLTKAAQALADAANALSHVASALSGNAPALGDAVLSAQKIVDVALPAGVQTASESVKAIMGAEPAPIASVEAPEPVAAIEPAVDMEEASAKVEAAPELAVAATVVSVAAQEPVKVPQAVAAASAAPEADSNIVVPSEAMPTASSSDIATFKETVYQQFVTIKLALDGLKADGSEMTMADALYRSLVTIQNSSNYMGLDDIKIYAERTAGIVDQGRKNGGDFSFLVDLLTQECGIIEDMVKSALVKLAAEPVQPDAPAAPVPEAPVVAPVATAAPLPEERVVAAPAPQPAPVAQPEPVLQPEPVTPPEPVAQPEPVAPPEPVAAPAPVAPPASDKLSGIRPVVSAEPDVHDEMSAEAALESIMRSEAELQMVGFYLGSQEFTVPTMAVQEVIRYQTPAKLPSAPEFVAGVINLRGKMTPLVYLRDMLEVNQDRKTEDRFIIVCRRKGLQFGLIIERVHTMYRVPQHDIDWGIESHLGVNVDLISGLLKLNDNLVAIVSVDRIVDYVIEV